MNKNQTETCHNEIVLGTGEVFMSPISRDGRQGILFTTNCGVHEIGSKDPNWKAGEPHHPQPGETIIWLDLLASARVLQDVVNCAVLNMNGHVVMDRE